MLYNGADYAMFCVICVYLFVILQQCFGFDAVVS